MLQQGIIKPSTSRMTSPFVIVKKKDGSLRLACDYPYINSFTIECQYPMPVVKDVLYKVGKSDVISIFDCRSAYWTFPVKESEQWKAAVVTHNYLYEFTRIPFGMVNSGRTFVKAINMVLKPINEFAEPYVADIAVHSDDWQMHLKHLEAFLMKMRKHNLTLNLKKCIFAKPKVKFVGQIVYRIWNCRNESHVCECLCRSM